MILRGVESICYDGKGINWIVLFFERRSRSDCVHEQVAKLGPVSRAAGMDCECPLYTDNSKKVLKMQLDIDIIA